MGVMLWSDAALTHRQDSTSKTFQNLTDILGVDKRYTTPYHLESNGVVVRSNCTLKNILAKVLNENKSEWNLLLPQEHIRQLCIHPQMSHLTVSHAFCERSSSTRIDLIVGDGPGTKLHQSAPTYVQDIKTST